MSTIFLSKHFSESFTLSSLSIIVLLGNIVLAIVSISYERKLVQMTAVKIKINQPVFCIYDILLQFTDIIIDASLMALYTSYLIYLASIESHVVR